MGGHLHGLAHEQHSSEKTSQRWQYCVGNQTPNLFNIIKFLGSVDSGISPHDDESPPQWSNPHASRPSVPTSKPHLLPSHNYINLDPRSKQSQVKVSGTSCALPHPGLWNVVTNQIFMILAAFQRVTSGGIHLRGLARAQNIAAVASR